MKNPLRVPFDVLDVMGLIGLCLFVYGIYCIFVPGAFIVVGSIFMALAFTGARKDGNPSKSV